MLGSISRSRASATLSVLPSALYRPLTSLARRPLLRSPTRSTAATATATTTSTATTKAPSPPLSTILAPHRVLLSSPFTSSMHWSPVAPFCTSSLLLHPNTNSATAQAPSTASASSSSSASASASSSSSSSSSPSETQTPSLLDSASTQSITSNSVPVRAKPTPPSKSTPKVVLAPVATASPSIEAIKRYASQAYTLTTKLAYSIPKAVVTKLFEWVHLLVTDPRELATRSKNTWGHIKAEAKHYWLGTKLLMADVQTSSKLLGRVLQGHTLTRRERQQLLRTSADLLRLVPMSVFVLIPFMELLLPVALKLFPNMLPSTFQTSSKQDEDMKRQLSLRMDVAVFLQDAVKEIAKNIHNKENDSNTQGASELLSMIEDVRLGKMVPTDTIVKCAQLFKDELTLDNISRPQLVAMSRYMGLNPYLTDSMLRFQIRNKIRAIKQDDSAILWEGIDSLNREELRTACADRGMRSIGLTDAGYRRQLRQWLDLSINKSVPASLLIMSRAFTITATKETVEQALQDSISSFDVEMLTEAVLESAPDTKAVDDAKTIRKLRLESLEYQNELIEDESKEAAAAAAAAEAEAEELLKATAAATAGAAAEADEAPAIGLADDQLVEPVPDAPFEEPDALEDVIDDLDEEHLSAREHPYLLDSKYAAALSSLVSDDSVDSERAKLLRVKFDRLIMGASDLIASGHITRPAADSAEADVKAASDIAAAVAIDAVTADNAPPTPPSPSSSSSSSSSPSSTHSSSSSSSPSSSPSSTSSSSSSTAASSDSASEADVPKVDTHDERTIQKLTTTLDNMIESLARDVEQVESAKESTMESQSSSSSSSSSSASPSSS